MGAVQSAAADGEALDAHGHVSEDVLHAGAHAAAHLVPQALALGERLVAPRLLHGLQADLHLTHGRMVVGRAVGAVGQVLLPGVAVLGQVGQGLAVVHVGWAHHEVVDQLAVAVHLHVVLVAEVVLAVLAAPARVDVLLPGLAGAPAAWGLALLDALVSSRLLRCTGAFTMVASTILPWLSRSPVASMRSTKASKSASKTSALRNCSR